MRGKGAPPFEATLQMKSIQLVVPEVLLLAPAQSMAGVERRSQFLLALKYFELGELSSGQAAGMCGLSRPGFLLEAGRHGVSVAELDPEELETEFAHA